ncbi:MAG: ribosome small subunit-dependent GTPase A [Bacteroidota bacterium]
MRKRPKSKQKQVKGPQFEGRVIRSVGSSIRVQTETGEQYDCVVRGKFRIKDLKTTNPVAVGDQVQFRLPAEGGPGVITDILPRKNYILRKAIGHAHKVHILCANVDQAILTFTVDYPPTSTGFANRFLLVAEAYDIPAVIVINKVDQLSSPDQKARLQEIEDIYREVGYPVHTVSALDPAYRDTVNDLLRDQVSFIGGHSGAGKSTLINLVDPELDIRTGEISDYSMKGTHTTTYAEMHPLQNGGYIIDSPGIKEWGIAEFEPEELRHFFPEMRELLHACRFRDCMHQNEPGCAVKAGLENGQVHPSRYDSYIRMLEELKSENSY